jgi:hypothetical protein
MLRCLASHVGPGWTIIFWLLLRVTAYSIRNSIETKAENNRLETKQYPVIHRNLTENIMDSGARRPHFCQVNVG